MRREHFTLETEGTSWVESDDTPRQPALRVIFSGAPNSLRNRLNGIDDSLLSADEIDVTVRFQDSPDEPNAEGVLALTNRITGDYALEVNVTAESFLPFVTAGRRYGKRTDDDTLYRLNILVEDTVIASYEKKTLLVYSDEGGLLRSHSLIPSGVQL